MPTDRSTRVALAAVALTSVLAVLYVFSSNETKAPNVMWAGGFLVDNSPAAAVAFPGNEIIVVADVLATLPPRWNTVDRDEPGVLSFIFTPVRVRVVEVLRGDPRLHDGDMIVRRLGGRVGADEFVFDEDLAPRGVEPGNRVLLFLGEQRDLGDGLDAATPNVVYLVDSGGGATSSDGRWLEDLAVFRDLLSP